MERDPMLKYGLSDLINKFNAFQENPNYSLSLNVPDAKASDVHVTLEYGQTLKVEINSQQNKSSAQKSGSSQMSEWGPV